MKETIFHLLVPGEFKVQCRPGHPVRQSMNVTNLPSKCNCVNCLTQWRKEKGMVSFRKRWTDRHDPLPVTPELEE